MRSIFHLRSSIWLIALWLSQPNAHGQAQAFAFSTQTQGSQPASLANGGTIQLPAVAVGSSSSVTLIINSSSSSQYTVSAMSATGKGFSAGGVGTPVPANGTAAFLITFTPPGSGNYAGTLALTLTGPGNASVSASFNLTGSAVQGVLISYIISPNGNQTLIAGGGTIAFPQTQVNATTAAVFLITNRSAAAVTLNSVLLLGNSYQLSGLPLFPDSIPAGSQVPFTLTFTPTTANTASGTLTITIDGTAQAITLTGQGAASVLSFAVGNGTSTTAVSPGGTIPLGSAQAGSGKNQTSVVVTNTGNLNAQVSGLSVSNGSFTLPNPPALPVTLVPGGSVTFTIAFAPQAPGNMTGTLSIGNATFTLTGTGLGPQFTVTLIAGSQSTPIAPGATATLPNTSVGSQLPFTLQVSNTGNQSGTVSAMSLAGTAVSLVQPPALPFMLAAGTSVAVNAVFAPQSTGIVNIAFELQGQGYGIQVTGDPPPALPAVTFANVTSQMTPMQQPALGLTLASPYPFDLSGVLTLTFAADTLGDDPNVQFIAGARFVSFKIPANSTQAIFGSGKTASTAAPFQTGTTAGTITLSASFALGSFDVTSGKPVTQVITIPEAVPVIGSVQIASESSGSLTLLIIGYSTPRSMNSLMFQFNAAPGAALQTASLTADVSKAFTTWFQSSAGVSFGSQFSITAQLSVNGALSAIQSIAVTAANANGVSQPVTLPLQ